MIHITIYDVNQMAQTKAFLKKKYIDYVHPNTMYVKTSIIELNSHNFLKVYTFLVKNNIAYYVDKYDVLYQLLKNDLFDDITILFNKYDLFLKIVIEDSLRRVTWKCPIGTVDYVLSLNTDLDIDLALRMACARRGDCIDIVRLLIDYHLRKKNHTESISISLLKRAMISAVESGNNIIVKMLIDYGAVIDSKSILVAIENDNIDIAEYLAKVGFTYLFDYELFLYKMSCPKSMAEFIDFLVQYPDSDGYTIIDDNNTLKKGFLRACKTGALETVIAFVEHTNLNVKKMVPLGLKECASRKHISQYLNKLI